ncbi:MAG: S-layer homology domain-containing protein [Oscillospiraceae bacterium]|nr:S-layer homology domain-containing protein [Oscillospiraceae bacterium]
MKQRSITALLLAAAMLVTAACGSLAAEGRSGNGEVKVITLSSTDNGPGTWSHSATLDGQAVPEYDYTWNVDPAVAHDEVKNAPAEYYTGTKPSGEDAVYIAHDIFYYPELSQEAFKLVNYDGDREWAYYYTAPGYEDYIFATLPAGMGQNSIPTQMMHSAEEAYENAVLHITQPGTYRLEGTWHGQIRIDLGDTDATFTDPNAKVTLLLNGVNVTCTVAPALVFDSLYECDNTWEERSSYTATVDTTDAGATVVILDGTVNDFNGTNVYRMLKTTYKKDGVTQKKQRKTDAAFYSYVTMNITGGPAGTGVLNITSGYEGLDTELHLSINGGNVNIFSQDDGINVNEDGVSVVTFNGGNTHILAGLGSEGDGVDSNGFLVVNGGTVISLANPAADAGLDSDSGSFINGGTVVALGSTMDWAKAGDDSDSKQAVMNLQFASYQSSDEAIVLTDSLGKVVFAYDPDKDEVAGSHARQYRGAIVSAPALLQGETYHLYVGGDVTGTETAGVYDPATVTGFTGEAKQQCWNGTWEDTGRGGFGGQKPDGMTRPDGFDRGQLPDGFDRGQGRGDRPNGFGGGNGQEPLEGMNPGEGMGPPDDSFGGFGPDEGFGFDGKDDRESPNSFDRGQMGSRFPGDMGSFGGSNIFGDGETQFTLSQPVNNFSGVMDYAPKASNLPFKDLREDMEGYGAVKALYEAGVMNGTGTDTFSPDMTVTRAQAVTVLARLAGAEEAETNIFTDVEQGSWYSGFVGWAVEHGIVQGDGEGHFMPYESVTAEHMALMLGRFSAEYENKTSFTGALTRLQLAQMLSDVM